MIKRIISLVLVLVLLMSLGLTMSAGAAATKKPYTYIAFGDSIASGYGLAKTAQAYPARLSGLVSAGSVSYAAKSGMKSADLLASLQDAQEAAALKIAQPDLITVSIGAGDLLNAFLQTVATAAGVPDPAQALADQDKMNAVVAALTDPTTQAAFAQTAQATAGNIAQIAKLLRDACPKAQIVFTNAYNPYVGIVLQAVAPAPPGSTIGGAAMPLDVGTQVAEPLITALNQATTQAAAAIGAKVVDVKGAFEAALAKGTNLTNVSKASLDPHPNAAGHLTIANAIYKMVKSQLPKVTKPAMVARLTRATTAYKSQGKGWLWNMGKNSRVVVYSWNDQYAKIAYKTGYAYVKTSALELKPLVSQSYKLAYPTLCAPVYTSTKANKKLATVYKYNSLLVLGKTGVWAKVQIGNKTGYIRNRYIKYVK